MHTVKASSKGVTVGAIVPIDHFVLATENIANKIGATTVMLMVSRGRSMDFLNDTHH
jgi:hypothetical protein